MSNKFIVNIKISKLLSGFCFALMFPLAMHVSYTWRWKLAGYCSGDDSLSRNTMI